MFLNCFVATSGLNALRRKEVSVAATAEAAAGRRRVHSSWVARGRGQLVEPGLARLSQQTLRHSRRLREEGAHGPRWSYVFAIL